MDVAVLFTFLQQWGLIGVVAFICGYLSWYLYKSKEKMLEERGGLIQAMYEKRIEDIEKNQELLQDKYEKDREYLEQRIEALERNSELMLSSFNEALNIFKNTSKTHEKNLEENKKYNEKVIEKMERIENKVDKIDWEITSTNSKIDKLGE